MSRFSQYLLMLFPCSVQLLSFNNRQKGANQKKNIHIFLIEVIEVHKKQNSLKVKTDQTVFPKR